MSDLKTSKSKNIIFGINRVVLGLVIYRLVEEGAALLDMVLKIFLDEKIAYFISDIFVMVLYTFLCYLYLKFIEKKDLKAIGITLNKSMVKIIPGILIGAISIGVTVFILAVTGNYEISINKNFSVFNIFLSQVIFLFSAAYGEEVLTRAMIQHYFVKINPVFSIVFASALFSALHLFNPSFSLASFISIFLAGLYMGALVYATGDIWAAVGMHFAWNFFQGPIFGVPISGMNMGDTILLTKIIGKNELITGGQFGAEGSIVCIIVMIVGTIITLYISKKNGKYKYFKDNKDIF